MGHPHSKESTSFFKTFATRKCFTAEVAERRGEFYCVWDFKEMNCAKTLRRKGKGSEKPNSHSYLTDMNRE